jgi:hypothetical protein
MRRRSVTAVSAVVLPAARRRRSTRRGHRDVIAQSHAVNCEPRP